MQLSRYTALADLVQAEISAGRLRPGDRLPTQREFAEAHRIATSTAIRAYAELVRRGLVAGEVGRGTFVRTGPPTPGSTLAAGIGNRVNLAVNVPLLPTQAALLTASTAQTTRRARVIGVAMETVVPQGTTMARRTVASLVARKRWHPSPGNLLFTGNGRQALAAVLAAIVPPGQRLGVEALSYQSVAAIAARLGIEVVPLPMDGHGLRPDGLARAHERHALRAVYLQPTLHNPLGITMPLRRRVEIVRTLGALDLTGIEDHVCAFLADDWSPLAALAPDRVVLLDSLSKRVAPGLTLGWVWSPTVVVTAIAEAIRAAALVPSGLALELSVRWIADGTVARLVRDKRRDASRRQAILQRACHGLTIQADPRGLPRVAGTSGTVARRVLHRSRRRARHRGCPRDGLCRGHRARAKRRASGLSQPIAQGARREPAEPPDTRALGPANTQPRVTRLRLGRCARRIGAEARQQCSEGRATR